MAGARVAIVDPYSSGALLAPAFAARGRECVAVHSRRNIPEIFRSSFAAEDFIAILQADDGVSATAAELARRGVGHVLAGSEPGVELADELSERLELVANGPALRTARRDKYLMAEAVRSHGLRTPAQLRSPRLEELREWARRRGWPVIAKPSSSVASDSVAICRNEDELNRAHEAIAGRTNVLGLVNDGVLVQEFVNGPEYVVDTVSYGGHHRVAAFWRYHRAPASGATGVFYGAMELLPYDGERQQALLAYAFRALDALEIRFGPAHTELIWADGTGPVLVEIGARLSAGNNAVLSRLCGGPCPLDLTLHACLDPKRFRAAGRAPRLTRTAINCFLIRPDGHRLRAQAPLADIDKLPSFHRISIARTPHRRPVVGVVTLIHPRRRVALNDLRRLRQLERTRLYEPVAASRRGS